MIAETDRWCWLIAMILVSFVVFLASLVCVAAVFFYLRRWFAKVIVRKSHVRMDFFGPNIWWSRSMSSAEKLTPPKRAPV